MYSSWLKHFSESPIASLGLLPYPAAQPFPTPPNDQTALADGHRTNIYGTNPSPSPFRGLDPEFGGLSTQHTPQADHSYEDFFNEVVGIPITPKDFQEDQNRIRLEAAKKVVDPQYHPGLQAMLKYATTNDLHPDLVEIAPAVQAGYAFINHELQQFTETFLRKWMTDGLYPVQRPHSDIGEQCSLDLRSLGIGTDAETEVMVRRVAQVRLYYWYQTQKKSLQQSQTSLKLGRGKDTRTKAIETLLERVVEDWESTDESSKQRRRKDFHRHKDIGKKWCELVTYLGEGILVVCGKDLDTKL
jgi:hypothetical protein